MEFFKYKFGKLPNREFDKFISYLDPDLDEIFINCLSDSDFVYGVFFAPTEKFGEVEKDLKNIHFDEIIIPSKYKDFPNNECIKIAEKQADLDNQINELKSK